MVFPCCAQTEQVTAELAAERANSQKLTGEHALLDRQAKELRAKLAELEAQSKARGRLAVQALESRIANLEEQLEAEGRERQAAQKLCRKLEKKGKESGLQAEEERRHAEQAKEQVMGTGS